MSLRLAIKRSLEAPPAAKPIIQATNPASASPSSASPPGSTGNNNINSTIIMKKDRPPRRPRRAVVPVILPEIKKCIRNSDPTNIDNYGFVEIKQALSKRLIDKIHKEAIERVERHEKTIDSPPSSKRKKPQAGEVPEVEEISNALQVDVSDTLLQKIKSTIENCTPAKQTMEVVFGKHAPPHPNRLPEESNYDGFVLETPKVLVTPPGSNPQLPHADDFCSSCIICLIHLRDDQEPTRVAPYDSTKDYPTGITVTCDDCNRMEQLPDGDYRRGVHLTDEKWHCDCKKPWTPYDFEGKLTKCFHELLEEDAPLLCDSYCGSQKPTAGDGILGLPTLIHRGPGNPTLAKESRYVLFFTLRPKYKNVVNDKDVGRYHKYNPALQIHASCILYNQFKKVKAIYERSGCGLEGYFNTIVGSETASLMREVIELKEENKMLRKKVAKKKEECEHCMN